MLKYGAPSTSAEEKYLYSLRLAFKIVYILENSSVSHCMGFIPSVHRLL